MWVGVRNANFSQALAAHIPCRQPKRPLFSRLSKIPLQKLMVRFWVRVTILAQHNVPTQPNNHIPTKIVVSFAQAMKRKSREVPLPGLRLQHRTVSACRKRRRDLPTSVSVIELLDESETESGSEYEPEAAYERRSQSGPRSKATAATSCRSFGARH